MPAGHVTVLTTATCFMNVTHFVSITLATCLLAGIAQAAPSILLESLGDSVRAATSSFDRIPEDRRRELEKISDFIRSKTTAGETASAIFICTHNSRRSHLSQVWAQTAATYYGVTGFKSFSGGVEVTACNERTVTALKRAGFEVTDSTGGMNPVYLVKYSEKAEPIRSFSKLYTDHTNPHGKFVAVMTCDHADANCPLVQGASLRAPIHYTDPKVADGTPAEAATYDERSRQIAREMFYMMSLVNSR